MTRPRTYTFLLIEDDPASRALVHHAVEAEKDLACNLLDIPDGATLEQALRKGPRYDLVLTGLKLNGMSGETLIARIVSACPGVPIVILTDGDETKEAATLLRRIGIGDYVLKTEGALQLLSPIIRTALDHAAQQRAAREAEERFKRMAENAPDMIFRWSYASGFEYVNLASTDIIGYTPEEHYADPGLGYRAIHPDDIPVYESVFSEMADPEGPRRYCVIRWFHKDGHIVHVEMRMTPIFDERGELVAIEGIARDISQHVIARERLRELTIRLTQAQEEERRRIARELHDEIGQALTIVKMRVRMLENALPEGATAAQEKMDIVRGLVDDTLQSVRALSQELRPPLLDELGWEAALSWLCESFSARTGLDVSCTHENEGELGRLDSAIELTIYRTVQEALTNIARHAEAGSAAVTTHPFPDNLQVIIEDKGKGFDLDALRRSDHPHSGLGLLGMAERVEMVGGHIDIDSEPGRGTRIAVVLPTRRMEERGGIQ